MPTERATTRPGSSTGDVVAEVTIVEDHPASDSADHPRSRDWDRTLTELAAISDETDTDELWSEALRALGVEAESEGE